MSVLFIMVGIPGSGKSYIAKQLTDEIDSIIVSRDSIRFSLLNEEDEYFSKEKEVFKTYINEIQTNLNKGKVVIADATHLDGKSRYKLLMNLDLTESDYIIPVVVEAPLEVCLKRNLKRTGRSRIPDTVLKNMSECMTDPTYDWPSLKDRYKDILYIDNKENR